MPHAPLQARRTPITLTDIVLPDADAWSRHCELLARRAADLRDPVGVARRHHERARVLLDELGEAEAAREAWRQALAAWPGHLPSFLALRGLALARDDRALAEAAFDQTVATGALEARRAHAAEAAGFFLLCWLFRWPDRQRARRALEALEAAGDPLALGPRVGHLFLDEAATVARLRHALATGAGPQGPLTAELARLLIERREPEGRGLLEQAAQTDAGAAWRLAESAARGRRHRELALCLEQLAETLDAPAVAAAVRFVAGELWELVLEEPARAAALYEQVRTGALPTALALKRMLNAAARFEHDAAGFAGWLADRGSLGAPALDGALARRAAHLFERAGDADRALILSLRAHERHGTDPRGAWLVERLLWSAGRWQDLDDHLEATASAADRVLRAALAEHALGDPGEALARLGPEAADGSELLALRQRQRLLGGQPEALLRAWQLEANAIDGGDRRADLYVRIARRYLDRPGGHEKALTYLFWVLDQDAEHLTALRLIEHVCRSTRRERPLMEVIARSLPFIDRPEERFPLERELGSLWEHAAQAPERAVTFYEKALASRPGDPETAADLARLYRQLDLPAEATRALDQLVASGVGEAEAADSTHDTQPIPVVGGTGPTDSTPSLVPDVTEDVPSDVDALLTRVAPPDARAVSIPPLPPLAPMRTFRRGETGVEEVSRHSEITGGFVEEDEDDEPTATHALAAARSHDSGLLEIPPARPEALDFLGEERTRAREEDPGRAVIAAKLRRSRGEAPQPDWPDHGDAALAAAVGVLAAAEDLDARVRAAKALADAYESAGHFPDAVRAWQAALGYHAGEAQAVERLEALYRRTGDWRGLVDILGRQADRLGDPARKHPIYLEIARILGERLNDPGGAVPWLRQVADAGDAGARLALAGALRAVRRWREYVEALHAAGAAEPDRMAPEAALDLGRVLLYHLEDAPAALPYIVAAARALPDRVDVAADLAEARAAAGEPDRAVELLEEAITAAGDARDARIVLRLRLARLLEEHAGDADRARQVYRAALRDGVRDPAVLDRVERLAVAAHDWETLAEVLQRALEDARGRGAADEDVRALVVRLGHLYYKRLERPRQAAEAFLDAYALQPDDRSLYKVIRGILAEHPAPALQIRLYETWLAHNRPSRRERLAAGLRLVSAYESEQRFEDAVRELETLRGLAPEDPEIRAALERVYRAAGRWSPLVDMYRAALREPGLAPEERAALLRRLAQGLEVGLRDLPGATAAYAQLLDQDPADLNALRALARLLEAQKRWTELLEVSAKELAVTRNARQRAYIHFRMGSLHETQLGDPEAARKAYRRALELDPRCFPALHGLREIAAGAGHWAAVVQHLRQELELWEEPRERAAVLARIGEIQQQHLRDWEQALHCYREAMRVWPGCVPAVRALANHAFNAGRYAEAEPLFQNLTNQNMDKWPAAERSEAFYKRGVVALRLGRQLEAMESLKLALEFDPHNTEAMHELLRAYGGAPRDEGFQTLMGHLDEAWREHAAHGRAAEQAAIDLLRGQAAEQGLDLEGAARYYARAAELRPGELSALRPLVELYVKQRRWADATRVLRQFSDARAAAAAADPEARHRVVEALLREGELWSDFAVDPARAVECYLRILEVEPGRREALYRMAQCHFLQGAFEDARAAMHALLAECERLQHGPAAPPPDELARHWFYLGRIEQSGFQALDRAERAYRRALEIDPRCAPALTALVRQLVQQGDDGGAARLLDAHQGLVWASFKGDPEVATLKVLVARILMRRGDTDGARGLLAPVAATDEQGARDARFALVDLHVLRGEPDKAAEPLITTLDADVCDVTALRALAGICTRRGDDERLLQVLGALELFNALVPEERARFVTLRERGERARTRSSKVLGDELVRHHVMHPSYGSPLVPLIGLCEPGLAARFKLDPPPDLDREQLVAGRRHALAAEAKRLEQRLEYKRFELYLAPDHEGLVEVWPADRPQVVLGGGATDALHQRFLVARALAFCRASLARVHNMTPERALEVLRLLSGLFTPRADEVEASEAFLRDLPGRVAEKVRQVVEASSSTLPAIYTGEAVLTGITRTADRLALLATGDLRPAVECLVRLESMGEVTSPGDDLTWAVRSASRLQDLVKYALSNSYHQARASSGLGI